MLVYGKKQLMKPRVYIETTIPSFYFEIRTQPDMVARKNWTVDWWNNFRSRFELVTSLPVIEELQDGNHPNKNQALELISKIPILPVDDRVGIIVEAYVSNKLMPNNPKGDALHLSLASYYNCHFLLTWNCSHLANANEFEHIRHINTLLGLSVPILTTPIDLMILKEIEK